MFLPLKILGFYSAHEPYLKPSAWYTIHIKKITTHTRWAQKPVINEVSYNPYKWPHKLVTGVVTLFIGVITPFITGSGAHLVFSPLKTGTWDLSFWVSAYFHVAMLRFTYVGIHCLT